MQKGCYERRNIRIHIVSIRSRDENMTTSIENEDGVHFSERRSIQLEMN